MLGASPYVMSVSPALPLFRVGTGGAADGLDSSRILMGAGVGAAAGVVELRLPCSSMSMLMLRSIL